MVKFPSMVSVLLVYVPSNLARVDPDVMVKLTLLSVVTLPVNAPVNIHSDPLTDALPLRAVLF